MSPLTPGEVLTQFIAYEEAVGLWDLSAAGQPYWHFTRYDVYDQIVGAMGLMGPRHGGHAAKPFAERVAIHPTRWPTTWRRSRWRKLRPVDVLVLPHPRFVPRPDGWICPYTGPLAAGLDHSHIAVKDLYEGHHPARVQDTDLRYLEWARRRAEIGFMFRTAGRGAHLNKTERTELAAWVAAIGAHFGVTLDLAHLRKRVQAALRNRMTLERVYTRLLDKTKPKAIVLAVHYSHRNLSLAPVAKARGIPIVEIQHGFFGATHVAYNVGPHRRPEDFPDYLLTFGDFWRETTPGLPMDAAQAPAVGFAWLEMNRAAAARAAAAAETPRDPRHTVLFVSQTTIAKPLADAAVALADQLDPAQFRVRFKHHPSDFSGWQQRYPGLVHDHIEVLDTPLGIYDAFTQADAQVGVYSTAIYEGLAFGLDTYVMTIPGSEAMDPLVERGAVTRCDDANALAAALQTDRVATTKARAELDQVWRPDAVANFRAFMTELIGPAGSR